MTMHRRLIPACGLGLALLVTAGCTADTAPGDPPGSEVAANAESAATVAAQPVLMGLDETEDACGGQARVKEGRTVSVRAAPGAAAAEVDRLEGGTSVFVCDGDETKPDWLGVAYRTAERTDCSAVASPAEPRTPIPATCASGWVQSDDLEMTAG
jgi:hypothetical protein